MFHKNARSSFGSELPASNQQQTATTPTRLTLVSPGSAGPPQSDRSPSPLIDLIAISAHRCSSFFAEAAVLVLVLALLDRFMARGRVEMVWVLTAFSISLGLLAASIATDFTARRWLKAH